RVPAEDVPRGRGDHEDEREHADRRGRRVGDDERKHGDEGDEHRRAGQDGSAVSHCARAAVLPNRPCGRIESTTTRAAKYTSGAHVGDHQTATTSLMTSRKTAAPIAPPMLPMPPRITIASSREMRS